MEKRTAIEILKRLKFDLSEAPLVDYLAGKVEAINIAIKSLSDDLVTCYFCRGVGQIYVARGDQSYSVRETCPICNGTGFEN